MKRLVENINKEYVAHIEKIKKISLYEENNSGNKKDKPYMVQFVLPDESYEVIVVKNLEKLSASLSYSKNTPSDCDYIIINLIEKEIYYIELKASNNFKLKKVSKQFLSGQQWLKHFCFCSDIENEDLETFTSFNVWWEFANGRLCSVIEPHYTEETNILKVQGSIFILSKIQHMISHSINQNAMLVSQKH
ncbi:hypothetical protein AB6878_09040 [Carnobacterium maltaromaticum]|uniref:hypothetical protein n=1 Tax=Carnobacterium maltaromaticum TaxID=2751 RepID=UPI0039BE693A